MAGVFGGGVVVPEEVEVKFCFGLGELIEDFETELFVEGNRSLGVFDANHGVIHFPFGVVRGFR